MTISEKLSALSLQLPSCVLCAPGVCPDVPSRQTPEVRFSRVYGTALAPAHASPPLKWRATINGPSGTVECVTLNRVRKIANCQMLSAVFC